ncbi:MAG: bifunctional shikimate kinase/3-dehydroquinate synthase [Acidobacteriota bacterium]|nr:bifunctional shikimate kinase/3-dehydroquinate synthase [Acidobacteriota bacterium]
MSQSRGIYLVGFSGSGKSTIARLAGEKLNWPAYDLDEQIEERSGMTIPVIFQREGEAGFRMRETQALRAISDTGRFVVATGGGTFISAGNRQLMANNGWTICLEGRPQTLLSRIQRQLEGADPKAIRPMLDAVYPLDQIRTLKQSRQPVYALADWTIHTDRLTAAQIADEVVRAAAILDESAEPPGDVSGAPRRHSLNPDSPPPIAVGGGPWPYYAVVDWGHLPALGEQLQHVLPHARKAAILTDARTWQRIGSVVRSSLESAGLEVHVRETAPNESIKTLDEVREIHDWLLAASLRRDDAVVVIGGGAIDDVGSFAASTYMRGIPLVKVPTSLEGIVDSSIGGKTAINHPRARNLIGTFFHPRLVWSDAALLAGEDPEELRSEWAEVVKYAMLESSLVRDHVMGETLFDQLEQHVGELTALDRSTLLNVVARCVALKAQVVAADERDLGQYRILLNYGHTIGHALETATRYQLPHGDAVAIGMAVEAALAVRLGMADSSVEIRQNRLLTRFHLPTRLPSISLERLLELVHHDKKVSGGAPVWILPVAVGRAVVSRKVSEADLLAVLRQQSG